MTTEKMNQIEWEKMNHQVPTIIQDVKTSQVLMLGYMNEEALLKTLQTQHVTFYSRSKKRLWTKGETSGHYLLLIDWSYDCDRDCLLILANPQGVTCHQGTDSCFEEHVSSDWQTLQQLENIIEERKFKKPTDSYITKLLDEGTTRIAQKVGEEAVEAVIAAVKNDRDELKNELADLFFHILVLLHDKKLCFSDVIQVLKERMKSE